MVCSATGEAGTRPAKALQGIGLILDIFADQIQTARVCIAGCKRARQCIVCAVEAQRIGGIIAHAAEQAFPAMIIRRVLNAFTELFRLSSKKGRIGKPACSKAFRIVRSENRHRGFDILGRLQIAFERGDVILIAAIGDGRLSQHVWPRRRRFGGDDCYFAGHRIDHGFEGFGRCGCINGFLWSTEQRQAKCCGVRSGGGCIGLSSGLFCVSGIGGRKGHQARAGEKACKNSS